MRDCVEKTGTLCVEKTEKLEKEFLLVKEKLGKRLYELTNDITLDGLITKNFALKKILSQYDINGKSLDLLVRSSKKAYDKIGIR